jgi:cytochrome c oxidase assembly protein subunit 15
VRKVRLLRKWAAIGVAMFLLVVLAGSVVRATGSGMGCPDWPKCFGLLIPPTEMHQVQFQPDRLYKKGQMIIKDGNLYGARETFTSPSYFASGDWDMYVKHNYANFVVHHTWIEFINRLIGALSGIPMLIVFIMSLLWFRHKPIIPIIATAGLIILLLVAWLGKVVVDGHLIPGQITLHMLGALLLVFVMVSLVGMLQEPQSVLQELPRNTATLLVFAGLLTLVQLLLGTQVREQLDVIMLYLKEPNRAIWIDQLDWVFYVHRSFSILLVLINGYLLWQASKYDALTPLFKLMGALLVFEILFGISIAYLQVPAWAQPPHLVLSFLLFGAQVLLWWQVHAARLSKEVVKVPV